MGIKSFCSIFKAEPMKSSWQLVLVLLLASSQFSAVDSSAQNLPDYSPGMVVVQFAPDTQITNKSARTGLAGFDRTAEIFNVYAIERAYPFLDHAEPTPETRDNLLALRRTYYVRYHANAQPVEVSDAFSKVPGIVYAEPLLIRRATTLDTPVIVDPNDPRFNEQTELQLLRLPEVWNKVTSESGDPQVVIAIVDDGTHWRHEDLRANVWTNEYEIPNNGLDDDDNGFVDDVHGVNLNNDSNNDPADGVAIHGTLVSGAAGAVSDNGIGISGSSWNADLMHVQAEEVMGGRDLNPGILYAAMNQADIINVSYAGHGHSQHEDQVLNLATDMGSLIVAAAGNENNNVDIDTVYPANHPRVLGVGATEKDSKTLAPFSNYGARVNVFAPGTRILTTAKDGAYNEISGTSFATPLVAGVAALVKTKFPNITPDALRKKIQLSTENIDAENPEFAGRLGHGFVNAVAAIEDSEFPLDIRVRTWSFAISGDGEKFVTDILLGNYFNHAKQLKVSLRETESYPFIRSLGDEIHVGSLAERASTTIKFNIGYDVNTVIPWNKQINFNLHIKDGPYEETLLDTLSFRGSYFNLVRIHSVLEALYTATGGNQWDRNDNWDIEDIPSLDVLEHWYGISLQRDLNSDQNGYNGRFGLKLGSNNLTGVIPDELGNLSELVELNLQGNLLTGQVPPELGNLSNLEFLFLGKNNLTGVLPRSLMQLPLNMFEFGDNGQSGNQGVCAPNDDEFQAWLKSIEYAEGPVCTGISGTIDHQQYLINQPVIPLIFPEATGLDAPVNYSLDPSPPMGINFNPATRTLSGTPTVKTPSPIKYTYTATDANGAMDSLSFYISVYTPVEISESSIENLNYLLGEPISPLVLPQAHGGIGPIMYTLNPAPPAGLRFDPSTRTLRGTPRLATSSPVEYTYRATDGVTRPDSLLFQISVSSPTASQRESLPQEFTLLGNYPNPFLQSTRLTFHLPWHAEVQIDVMDIIGRRVLTIPKRSMAAGWNQSIELNARGLPSGLYLYRLIASSPVENLIQVGRFVKIH